jgi:hypothetical protein
MYRTKSNPLDLILQPLELVDADGNRTVRSIHGEFSAEQMFAHGYYLDVAPEFDPSTHKLGTVPTWNEEAGTVTLAAVAKSETEIMTERRAYCDQIKEAGKAYLYAQIDADGIALVERLVAAGHPYGVANSQWCIDLRKEQYRRMAVVEAGVEDFTTEMLNFSSHGEKPYTVVQMMLAAGM